MSEWTSDELGRLAELRMGQSPPGSVVGELRDGLPFLQGNAEFGVRSPRPRYQCNEAPRRAEPDDVLISVRAPVGAINIADQACGIGRGLAAVRFSKLDQRFGHRALQETAIMLDRVSQGTTFAAIGRTELASLRLPVPPNVSSPSGALYEQGLRPIFSRGPVLLHPPRPQGRTKRSYGPF